MENFLPERIQEYLHNRGLKPTVLQRNKITWDGARIVIPIFDKDGIWLFNKYRRDPALTDGPKYTYDKGSTSALYGAEKLSGTDPVIICEGEFDALILEAQGLTGVSSTGGAGTFKLEWFDLMAGKEVYVCFDNDKAGLQGMERVTKMHPETKAIFLPGVPEHGDITDYFMAGNTRDDFEALMRLAVPLIVEQEQPKPARRAGSNGIGGDKLQMAKAVPLNVILKFNKQKFAKCPFHTEKTASLHWFGENRWKCFGCGEQGDSIDLVMKMLNLPMKDAIEHLLKL